MYQRHKDTHLLEEAYKATQLTQHLPNLTLKQVKLVIENASPAELEVLEELFGGIKNIARGAKEGAQRAGQAVGKAARGAGQAVGQAARGAGQAVGQAARGGVEAVKAGAQQVGQNVKDMYQSGEDEAAAGKRKKQLQDHLTQLEQLFTQHIEASPSSRLKGQNLNDLTLGQLKQALAGTAGVKERKATAARDKGVFGGAGGAAKAGYQQGAAPAPAPAPAGGAAPAPA
jgi:uncharacterized phage infection (PIP) family protein YhgE